MRLLNACRRVICTGHLLSLASSACVLVLIQASCSSNLAIPGPADHVNRKEAIEIAQAYRGMLWTPSQANIQHGRDRDGVLVHTPDANLANHGYKNGWWQPDTLMAGMPYQWGGFDTPWQFMNSLLRGEAAGDIATPEKRRLDDAGTSRFACGIDCSGFVSRCWRLERPYSTDELHLISTPLSSNKQLKAGDIFLKNGHVLLFWKWDPTRADHILAFEATPHPMWRVNLGSVSTTMLKEKGYAPWRYRQIRD